MVWLACRERWQSIPGWDGLDTGRPSDRPLRLNHGYDETRPHAEFDVDVMKAAAEFRGGRFLSSRMTRGDLTAKLRWQCAFGHEFDASLTLVLLAGHWCPRCLPPPWNDDEIARRNPFFAQVPKGALTYALVGLSSRVPRRRCRVPRLEQVARDGGRHGCTHIDNRLTRRHARRHG